MFKVGDKVTILLSSLPTYKKRNIGKATFGTIIEGCPITDCMIVKLNTGKEVHLFTYNITLATQKNQQLEFAFME